MANPSTRDYFKYCLKFLSMKHSLNIKTGVHNVLLPERRVNITNQFKKSM
mgnify:CR=1 FL=1